MADINQLNAQVKALEKEISRLRREAAQESERIARNSQEKIQRLKNECEQMLANDRAATDAAYRQLLDSAVSDLRNDSEERLRETEQRYYALKLSLDEELQKQKAETQKLNKAQRDFQREYEESLEISRSQAEEQIRQATSALRDFDETEPYEWFPPNNRNFFYEHLDTAVQCFNSGIYQAAIGIADSLILSIEIERNRINHLLDRWIKNYMAMKTILDSEKKLIQVDSRSIDWMGDELLSEWGVSEYLPDEIIGHWINSEYYKHVKAFEELAENTVIDTGDISIDGSSDSRKQLKKLMRASKCPENSSAESMYSIASVASVRLGFETRYLCSMRSRINCYDERCNLKMLLDNLFEEIGFSNSVNRFENNDAREMLSLAYDNDYKDNQSVMVFIIPVYSELNNKWYNTVGYSIVIGDYEVHQQISEMLFTALANTNPIYEETNRELTVEQISGRLKQHFRSAINGHN